MRPSRMRARQLLLRRQLLLTVRRADTGRLGAQRRTQEHEGSAQQPHQQGGSGSAGAQEAASAVCAAEPVSAPVTKSAAPPDSTAAPLAQVWRELTERQVALCRQDRQRWTQAMDRAEELQEQGLPASQAVRQALDEAGG